MMRILCLTVFRIIDGDSFRVLHVRLTDGHWQSREEEAVVSTTR